MLPKYSISVIQVSVPWHHNDGRCEGQNSISKKKDGLLSTITVTVLDHHWTFLVTCEILPDEDVMLKHRNCPQ